MNKYYLTHSGVGHDDGPPGRGSGRYPYGSGDRPMQDIEYNRGKNRSKIKNAAKTAGRIIVKSALLGATTAAKVILSTTVTGATLTGIAAVGFNFVSSPECQSLINNVANRAGTWFFKNYVESAATNANQNLDAYLYLGNEYLKSMGI